MDVWDEFLTERDKQHLEQGWGKPAPFGFGEHPCVLVIDDCYLVVGDRPLELLEATKAWPASCGVEGWEAIYRTQQLLAAARANGVPVIYTKPKELRPPLVFQERVRVPQTWSDRKFEIVKEIAPEPGEVVIEKSTPSAFFATTLLPELVAGSIDTIIACGNSTSGCVRASVLDGHAYRFKMGIVEECTFDRTQASHAINLFDMHMKYGDVVSVQEATTYFGEIQKE